MYEKMFSRWNSIHNAKNIPILNFFFDVGCFECKVIFVKLNSRKKVYKEGSCSLTEFFKIIKQTIKEGVIIVIIIYEREMRKNTQQK